LQNTSIEKDPSRLADFLTVGFLSTVWGLAWPFTVLGLRYTDPLVIASVRSIIGGLVLLAWRQGNVQKESFDRRAIWITFVAGTCWVGIPMALTAWALQYITGGLGSILQSTTPFFVAFFAYFLLKESQLTRVLMIGLVIGFLGIIVLFSDDPIEVSGGSAFLAGVAVLITSACIGFAQAFSRRYFKRRDLIGFNMYVLLFAGFETLPFCFLGGAPRFSLTPELAVALLYLGIMATAIPFVMYFKLFQRINIVLLSMISYVIPLVAVLAGILWLGERMTLADILGSALVLLGVVFATQLRHLKLKLPSRFVS